MAILSASELVSLGCSFVDLSGRNPPSTVSLVSPDERLRTWRHVAVRQSAFTSFVCPGPKVEHRGSKAERQAPGNHVALSFDDTSSFFSLVMVRCDTWAVQWAVSQPIDLESASVTQLVALDFSTVCGIYSSSDDSRRRLFIASRSDVPRVDRSTNRERRSFVAAPRLIEEQLIDSKEVVHMVAAGCDRFFVLMREGTVYLVIIKSESVELEDGAPSITKQIVVKGLKGVEESTRMVIGRGDVSCAFLVVYTEGSATFYTMDVEEMVRTGSASTSPKRVTLKAKSKLERIEAAGACHLLATLRGETPALQFISMVPGRTPDDLQVIPLSALTLKYPPVATGCSRDGASHTILCRPTGAERSGKLSDEQALHSLMHCRLGFTNGPYSQETLDKTRWSSVTDLRTTGATDAGLLEEVPAVREWTSASAPHGMKDWGAVRLHYVLAHGDKTISFTPANLCVFAIKTAPYIHTRLTKQWHNATFGLKAFLTMSPFHSCHFAAMWNPRHLRRAFRLMSQEEISRIFRGVVACIRAGPSTEGGEGLLYAEAATAAVNMATQIITLSRQLGVELRAEDVEVVAVLLRASRQMGHEILSSTHRMGVIMDSYSQRKAMRSLLSRSADDGEAVKECHALTDTFFGVQHALQVEHSIHMRYAPSAWTEDIQENRTECEKMASDASKYLNLIQCGSASVELSDWGRMGKSEHPDATFSLFESSLVRSTKEHEEK